MTYDPYSPRVVRAPGVDENPVHVKPLGHMFRKSPLSRRFLYFVPLLDLRCDLKALPLLAQFYSSNPVLPSYRQSQWTRSFCTVSLSLRLRRSSFGPSEGSPLLQ